MRAPTIPAELPAGVAAVFDRDENMRKLMADLPEHWAAAPVDDAGERDWVEEVVLPHLRAAYGSGYMKALAEPPGCPVPPA